MPTALAVARECLAEEAAGALDEAVRVAKRRNHAQTSSLHVVSALLALPASLLREACTRSRSAECSPRLQFRALELCVGVALDRVSASKAGGSEGTDPPVSNSLMAAIKRSQANQRRHPDTFLLYQQQLNSNPGSPISIYAVKVEMKHFVVSILDDPIVNRVFGNAGFRTEEMKFMVLTPPAISRFRPSASASRLPPPFPCSLNEYQQGKLRSNFPFLLNGAPEEIDGNSRRISDILLKPSRRNPLLIGACAGDAYGRFLDCLKKKEPGILPKEIEHSALISMELEVSEMVDESAMEMRFRLFDDKVGSSGERRIVAHFGDLKALVESESLDLVSFVVTRLKQSLLNSGGSLCIVGFLGGDDLYKKLVERVPSVETDWDLGLLPITSSGKCFKSSLMKSFVPFAGFFPMPSETGTTSSNACQLMSLCNSSNVAGKQSEDPHSGLRIGESETSNTSSEAKEGSSGKGGGICPKLMSSQGDTPLSGAYACSVPSLKKFPFSSDLAVLSNGNGTRSSSASQNNRNQAVGTARDFDLNQMTDLPVACSVTTDLRLGTSSNESFSGSRGSPTFTEDHHNLQNYESSYYQAKSRGNVSNLSNPSANLYKQMHAKELEGHWKALAEKLHWQIDAIQAVHQAVSRWKYEDNKGCLWFSFLGPDKVGKRRVAGSLPEIVFGRNGRLLCYDLSMEDTVRSSDSIVDRLHSKFHGVKPGRKVVVDCIADDLRRHPNSVVLLENVDKADVLIQDSLSLAVKTSKFQDSHGREMSIQGAIFVLASSILHASVEKAASAEFSEEQILEAKNMPMKVSFGATTCSSVSKVFETPHVWIARSRRSPAVKRKYCHQISRAVIDLNLPAEETQEDTDALSNIGSHDVLVRSMDISEEPSSSYWMQEFHEHVDEVVLFKPFNFDSLAHQVVREINLQLADDITVRLEIDEQVMVQILAAIWLAEDSKAWEDWIERVLCRSTREARRRCSGKVVMRLEHHRHGIVVEEHPGLCLPARIHLS